MTQQEWIEDNPLRQWRIANCKRLVDVAEFCHVCGQAVYQWEAGLRNPKLDNFIAILHYTGINARQWSNWMKEKPDGKHLQAQAHRERQESTV